MLAEDTNNRAWQIYGQRQLAREMWVLAPQLWEDLLTEYGFRVETIDLLSHPDESATVVQQLIRARRLPDRPSRITSRPRSTQVGGQGRGANWKIRHARRLARRWAGPAAG
ncbi:hypothetical protein ACIRQO_10690 [Streptomyces anulatus]|uniref:hypothetical protein n=1 Tax=Streptomyces sp. wa1063 TaxID=1828212 RepID=UPI00211D7A05|nr:hypothetical protein [Streptomyces sp. wa1063]